MSIWHSPTPILENQRDPRWLALLKNSVRIGLAAGKRVSQFDGSIRVKHVTVQSPQPAGWELERSEVEAFTRFLDQYAGVKPVPAPDDPFENFQPTKVDVAAESVETDDEAYTATPSDQALYLTLVTGQACLTIQQQYTDGKIADLDTYNRLYEVARKADVQARKLHEMLEKSEEAEEEARQLRIANSIEQ